MVAYRGYTLFHILVIAALVCFFVAFAVAVGWFGRNWFAWTSAGLGLYMLAWLVPTTVDRRAP